MGGLRYRDLHVFNLALLAKQYWNFLHNETSTIHVIFKAKYFPRDCFHTTSLGFQQSYLWRNLLVARELVNEGLAWRVGNDEKIGALTDKWVAL